MGASGRRGWPRTAIHQMVQDSRGIEARTTWYARMRPAGAMMVKQHVHNGATSRKVNLAYLCALCAFARGGFL